MDRQSDGQTDRWADRQVDRHTAGQTEDRQSEEDIYTLCCLCSQLIWTGQLCKPVCQYDYTSHSRQSCCHCGGREGRVNKKKRAMACGKERREDKETEGKELIYAPAVSTRCQHALSGAARISIWTSITLLIATINPVVTTHCW